MVFVYGIFLNKLYQASVALTCKVYNNCAHARLAKIWQIFGLCGFLYFYALWFGTVHIGVILAYIILYSC